MGTGANEEWKITLMFASSEQSGGAFTCYRPYREFRPCKVQDTHISYKTMRN